LRSCGVVYATPYDVPTVAWNLHLHLADIAIFPSARGVALAPRGSALARDPRYPRIATSAQWAIGSSCPR
jgi:hypothetical protein